LRKILHNGALVDLPTLMTFAEYQNAAYQEEYLITLMERRKMNAHLERT
jgi:hypothetical protein